MAPPCTICVSALRVEIDETLSLPKVSMRAVSRQFGIGRTALRNHMHAHLPRAVASRERSAAARGKTTPRVARVPLATAIRNLDTPADIVDEFRRLYGAAVAAMEGAEVTGDTRLVLAAMREAKDVLTQIGKTLGIFGDDRPSVLIDQSRRFTTVVAKLTNEQLEALARGEVQPQALGFDESIIDVSPSLGGAA